METKETVLVGPGTIIKGQTMKKVVFEQIEFAEGNIADGNALIGWVKAARQYGLGTYFLGINNSGTFYRCHSSQVKFFKNVKESKPQIFLV